MIGLFIALSIFAFVGGSYFGEKISSRQIQGIKADVKSAVTENQTKENNIENSNDSDAKLDIKVDSTPEPKENKTVKVPQEISNFIYPGSQILSSDSNNLFLKSAEDSKKITDWYKEKIKNEKLLATSFVTTSTNEKVLNKLAASGDYKIEVEISKDSASQSEIKVKLSK